MKEKTAFDLEWLKPESGEWPTCKWVRWTTRCGRYRIYRVCRQDESPSYLAVTVEMIEDKPFEWMVEADTSMGAGHPKYRKTIAESLAVVTSHLERVLRRPVVSDQSHIPREPQQDVKKTAPVAAPKKVSASSQPRTRSCDKFGCAVGSQAAKINAVVGRSLKDALTISTESGIPLKRVKTHLAAMASRGHVVVVGAKYKESGR